MLNSQVKFREKFLWFLEQLQERDKREIASKLCYPAVTGCSGTELPLHSDKKVRRETDNWERRSFGLF